MSDKEPETKPISDPSWTHERPFCTTCKSQNVVVDAWAKWDHTTQQWDLSQTFDQAFCHSCKAETKIDWQRTLEATTDRVRRLNDEMRESLRSMFALKAYGELVMTRGVSDLGNEFVDRALASVADFTEFSEDNDPHVEHDFGAFEIDGQQLFWKVDYFVPSLSHHSDDKSDIDLTTRVLTIMLASEY